MTLGSMNIVDHLATLETITPASLESDLVIRPQLRL